MDKPKPNQSGNDHPLRALGANPRFAIRLLAKRGPGVIEIDGAYYFYQAIDPGEELITHSVRLVKGADPFDADFLYDCSLFRDGYAECDCESFTYMNKQKKLLGCKHLQAIRELNIW